MAPPKSESQKTSQDPIQRGNKRPDGAGLATFVGLRLLDPFLQYGVLAKGYGTSLITTLRGTVLPQGPLLVTNTAIDSIVGLSPYRSILLGMSVAAMLKQNLHILFIMQERMEPAFATQVGVYNALHDTINSLLFICAQTSASANGEVFPQTPLLVGSTLFVLGLGLEFGSEIQRHLFKQDAANKGKVYNQGAFGLSRHINYFGYTLWRTGYAIASGGWLWGAAVASFSSAVFIGASIPALQGYLEKRYGEQYEQYKKAVPYAFIPFVY